jgi:hypothetical protein
MWCVCVQALKALKEKFVTGSWKTPGEDDAGAEAVEGDSALTQAMSQEEVYGDWEDIENDEVAEAQDEEDESEPEEQVEEETDHGITYEDDGRRLGESKKDAMIRRQKAKDALKSSFDQDYDQGGARGGGNGKKRRDMNGEDDEYGIGGPSIFDEHKADALSQAKINAVCSGFCVIFPVLIGLTSCIDVFRVSLPTRMLRLVLCMKVAARVLTFALN